jgi:hypothetical protein
MTSLFSPDRRTVPTRGDDGPVDANATGPRERLGYRVSPADPWWWLTTFVWGIVAGMMLVLIALGLR